MDGKAIGELIDGVLIALVGTVKALELQGVIGSAQVQETLRTLLRELEAEPSLPQGWLDQRRVPVEELIRRLDTSEDARN